LSREQRQGLQAQIANACRIDQLDDTEYVEALNEWEQPK
jgi:hypothetical protein